MTQIPPYIPRHWTKHRLDPNTIFIKDGTQTVCRIEHPHHDDRAEINADLIKALPVMLRALRSIEEYAKTPGLPTEAKMDEIADWATEALEAANWKE